MSLNLQLKVKKTRPLQYFCKQLYSNQINFLRYLIWLWIIYHYLVSLLRRKNSPPDDSWISYFPQASTKTSNQRKGVCYTNYTSHNTATHNIHTVTRYGSKVTYIKGPFIYYVSTYKGGRWSESCNFCLFSVLNLGLPTQDGSQSLKMRLRNIWMVGVANVMGPFSHKQTKRIHWTKSLFE